MRLEEAAACVSSSDRSRGRAPPAARPCMPRTSWSPSSESVVDAAVQQRMPQPRERRAHVVPRELRPIARPRRDSAGGRRRRVARSIHDGAQGDEAIGDQLRHGSRSPEMCKRIARARSRARFSARNARRPRARARRNFVYNWPLNGAFSHRRRIARPRARGDPRRHSRGPYDRPRLHHPRPPPPPGRIRPRPAHGDRVRSRRDPLRRSRRRDDRRPDRDDDRESRLAELAADHARRRPRRPPRRGAHARAGDASASRARRPRRRRQIRRASDVRDVLERASARETAARVAAGAIAKSCSRRPACRITSHVFTIGDAGCRTTRSVTFERAAALPDDAPLRCVDPDVEQRDDRGDRSRAGSRRHARRRVRSDRDRRAGRPRQLRAVGSKARRPAGAGADVDSRDQGGRASASGPRPPRVRAPASTTRSSPTAAGASATGVARPTNNAGGLEGGVTNGEELRVSAWMKPISTLMKPLRSVDLTTMQEAPAAIERSDVCAVPAAAVVGEAMVALVAGRRARRTLRRRHDRGSRAGDGRRSADAVRARVSRRR